MKTYLCALACVGIAIGCASDSTERTLSEGYAYEQFLKGDGKEIAEAEEQIADEASANLLEDEAIRAHATVIRTYGPYRWTSAGVQKEYHYYYARDAVSDEADLRSRIWIRICTKGCDPATEVHEKFLDAEGNVTIADGDRVEVFYTNRYRDWYLRENLKIRPYNPHHNYDNRVDVNGDGDFTPADLLVMSNASGSVNKPLGEFNGNYYDTNNDGHFSPVDILIVSNAAAEMGNSPDEEEEVEEEENPFPFHNAEMPADVNGDGSITPIDALIMSNNMSKVGSDLSEMEFTGHYYDTNGDGRFTAVDVLIVSNAL